MESGICWASHSRIGKYLGIHFRTVRRSLQKLVKLGLLEQKKQRSFTRPNEYTLTDMIKQYRIWADILVTDFATDLKIEEISSRHMQGTRIMSITEGEKVVKVTIGCQDSYIEIFQENVSTFEFLLSNLGNYGKQVRVCFLGQAVPRGGQAVPPLGQLVPPH